MASNSVASFLTKLLRQDKKTKQKQPTDNKRRHSAPGPNWLEIFEANATPENGLKLQEQKGKQKKKYSSQQNLSGIKRQNSVKTKPVNSQEKRQSASFPSWFCVSGNADTMDRTALPAPVNANANISKYTVSNKLKSGKSDAPIKADFLRQGHGKNTRDNKKRYSAPVPEWSTAKTPISEVTARNQNLPTGKIRRELSPGVKYRTDGTLEKPYVFPAGLTFGPEGRKLHLRRTTNPQASEKLGNTSRRNEKTVKVDVHRSSTEDIIMEYSYEDSDPYRSEFDVRKAFYLKYDSNLSYPAKHKIISASCGTLGKKEDIEPINDVALDWQKYENRWKPKDRPASIKSRNGSLRSSKGQVRAERSKNRYSTPSKNEDCVYMGSFENITIFDHLDKENQASKSSVDVSGNERSSRRDSKNRSRKNRYSLPPRNSDLVYMGSFENVNELLTGNNGKSPNLSLPNQNVELDVNTAPDVCERYNRFTVTKTDQPENCEALNGRNKTSTVTGYSSRTVFDPSVSSSELPASITSHDSEKSSSLSQECKTHSMPDLAFPTNLNIANNIHGVNAESEQEDEEDDVFDVKTLPSGRTRSWTPNNPFLRRTERSSCMPGNKRSIAPPPAIKNPSILPSSVVTSFHASSSRASFMPGKRHFSIPPPPSYTPPKEEMEFTQSRLKEMTCHKGSQTYLSIDFENLNMEDRDTSLLQQAEVKTIYAGSPPQAEVTERKLPHSRNYKTRVSETAVLHDKVEKAIGSPNLESSRAMLNISKISQGSDEVFRDNQSSFNDKNEATIPSKFIKVEATRSSGLDGNQFAKCPQISFSSASGQKHLEITNCQTKMKRGVTLSESSSKNMSPDSTASITSTPKEKRRSQPNLPNDSDVNVLQQKPVPHSRKVYSTAGLNEGTELFISKAEKDTQQTFTRTNNITPPVPKQRLSLTYSRSLSGAADYGKKLTSTQSVSLDENNKLNNKKLTRTQSDNPCSTLQRQQNVDSARSSVKDGICDVNELNIYEEIDCKSLSGQVDTNIENIYEECGIGNSENQIGGIKFYTKDAEKNEKQRFEKTLSLLQKIQLDASPRQQRRNGAERDDAAAENIDFKKRFSFYDNDDNNSIADDEMSLSNDEDTEDGVKRCSLRRCVSADNLLRSGSIIDRSMILAKRRRRRMRGERSKSQLALSAENKYITDFNKFKNLHYDDTKASHKIHYNKRKTTSNERLYKHKSSHTDSGHDSDIVSPCTSPDARRHVEKMTSSSYEHPSIDVNDSYVPRQGTLPKKPWEVRLRNIQYQRKSRSRENLLTLIPRNETTLNYVCI